MGIWHATCRQCGYRVSDPIRRRAAAIYREHIKEMNDDSAHLETFVIDMAEEASEPEFALPT
jgi:hypothetical protein